MSSPEVLAELNTQIAFQRKWRRITSLAYFTGAALSVIAAAAATVLAGFGEAAAATVVAALATISTSLEKVLVFREKWTLHRAVETDLDLVRLELAAGSLDQTEAVSEIERVIRSYSENVPIAGSSVRKVKKRAKESGETGASSGQDR